jgi:hypothetical protein
MKRAFLFGAMLASVTLLAQPRFSIATNVSGLRNFTPKQPFWAVGQNVQLNIHLSSKESAYASIDYYTEGKFKNNFTATAKSATVTPQVIAFTATGRLRYQQLSLGWKHYFTGSFSGTEGINFFGLAGFGYLFSKISNSASTSIDTTSYTSPVAFGQGKVKRLSLDLGVGGEEHLGGSVYLFATMRTWLPASYHPIRYLHNSDRVPLTLMAGVGIRVLFGFDY